MLEGSLQGEYAKYTGKKEVDSLLLKPKANSGATVVETPKTAKTPEEATEN
jgi:hypothetical protein